MEKTIIMLMILFTSLAIFLGSSLADEKRKTNKYLGRVEEVDLKEETIVVGKEGKSLGMLFIASNATFGNSKGLQDLKPGDKVAVEYDAIRGKTIAVSVTRE